MLTPSNTFDRSHTMVKFSTCVFTLSCQKEISHTHMHSHIQLQRIKSILTIQAIMPTKVYASLMMSRKFFLVKNINNFLQMKN